MICLFILEVNWYFKLSFFQYSFKFHNMMVTIFVILFPLTLPLVPHALVQILVCCQFSDNPLSTPVTVLINHVLREKFLCNIKLTNFHWQNCLYFCPGEVGQFSLTTLSAFLSRGSWPIFIDNIVCIFVQGKLANFHWQHCLHFCPGKLANFHWQNCLHFCPGEVGQFSLTKIDKIVFNFVQGKLS